MMVIKTGAEREGWVASAAKEAPLFPCYPARGGGSGGGPQTRACREPWRPLVSFP
jgi:hypothetical protein